MFKLTQSKIKLEFMCLCIRGNSFAPVSTILPLYIANLQCGYHGYQNKTGTVNSSSFAKCSGYPTHWNTRYDKEEHLADHKSFIENTYR
jgi:hypothetical protein